MKYIIVGNTIKAAIFDFKASIAQIISSKKCISYDQIRKLKQSYGPGTMIIKQPRLFTLFAR